MRDGRDRGLAGRAARAAPIAPGAALCRLDALAPGRAKGARVAGPEGPVEIFLVRPKAAALVEVHAYVNACPHRGTPLDWVEDEFLDPSGRHVVCATHGAVFRIRDGQCLAGPCLGARLRPVAIAIDDGVIRLAALPDALRGVASPGAGPGPAKPCPRPPIRR